MNELWKTTAVSIPRFFMMSCWTLGVAVAVSAMMGRGAISITTERIRLLVERLWCYVEELRPALSDILLDLLELSP